MEQAGEIGFNRYTILNLHGVLSENLLGDPGAAAIANPFEQSFFAMVHLPYLQPFIDVNKRVSRLEANIPFIQKNLCPLSFVDVPERANIEGILGVYELNRVELLRDAYVWAYHRSASRYSATGQSLGVPDSFRMRYRQQLKQIVQEVVQQSLRSIEASKKIRQFAEATLPERDRSRFIEVSETELMSLHEGNIARYRIRPSEFTRWREVKYWDRRLNATPGELKTVQARNLIYAELTVGRLFSTRKPSGGVDLTRKLAAISLYCQLNVY